MPKRAKPKPKAETDEVVVTVKARFLNLTGPARRVSLDVLAQLPWAMLRSYGLASEVQGKAVEPAPESARRWARLAVNAPAPIRRRHRLGAGVIDAPVLSTAEILSLLTPIIATASLVDPRRNAAVLAFEAFRAVASTEDADEHRRVDRNAVLRRLSAAQTALGFDVDQRVDFDGSAGGSGARTADAGLTGQRVVKIESPPRKPGNEGAEVACHLVDLIGLAFRSYLSDGAVKLSPLRGKSQAKWLKKNFPNANLRTGLDYAYAAVSYGYVARFPERGNLPQAETLRALGAWENPAGAGRKAETKRWTALRALFCAIGLTPTSEANFRKHYRNHSSGTKAFLHWSGPSRRDEP